MKRAIPYIGSVGLGALTAGLLLRLFQPERDRIWASLLIAGLLLTVFYLGTRWREVMALLGRRGARYGANLALLVLLVAGIVAAVNYLANRHNKRWDLTAAKQFTLSDQTVKILGNLKKDLQIIVFDRKENAQRALDLLNEYKYESKRIIVEVVDQEAQPARAAKYKTSTEANVPLGTMVIDAGGKVERVTSATEQEVTNAIIRVVKEGKKKIYFVEGHGEKSLDETSAQGISAIKTKLEESNYEVAKFHPLQSMKEGKINFPADAAALVVAGPQRDYLPAEIDALRSHLKSGGKALFLLDPEYQGPKPNLDAFVSEFNVKVGQNVVIDVSGVGQLFGFGPEVPLVASYGFHPITEKFGNLATVYPFVRTVEAGETSKEGVTVTPLLNTSENSWAETDLAELSRGRVRPDQGKDKKGPLQLAVALTIEAQKPTAQADKSGESKTGEDDSGEADHSKEGETKAAEEKKPQGRAVVVGDSDFIVNNLVNAPIGNRDLFLNMVNWAAEDEDLISIRPKEAEDRRVFLNAQQQKNVAYLSLLVIPGVFLLAGIFVWWEKR